MSKKDEAFELFGQGKTPDSPEMVVLGLAKDSLRKYYRLWEKLQTPVAEAPVTVSVGSLAIGAKFECKGKVYQKRESTLIIVSGLDLKETARTQQMTWKGFSPSTRVIPK